MRPDSDRGAAAWVVWHEGWLVFLVGTLAFVAIPLSLRSVGLSWDTVNHHIYLGWIAEHPRFDRDYLAASYQSYQYPYLYWPIYKLALSGASGTVAGLAIALMHATAIPAAWLIARSCIPGEDVFGIAMRGLAVLLAFMSGAILSMFDMTSNDLVAATPLLWAYALALRPVTHRGASLSWTAGSGLLAGLSVAFKLSNGFMALAMPLLWLWPAGKLQVRAVRCLLGGLCVLAGFAAAYGYWGWQLWIHYGNPIYPLYDGIFEPLRQWVGWHR
jgi:hypothetical protein